MAYDDVARAQTLPGVVDWLSAVAGDGDYGAQLANLERWAVRASPQDYVDLQLPGFGLGRFQYTRMRFGANTVKPDIHVRRYVASCVGHSVSEIRALELLERAAEHHQIRHTRTPPTPDRPARRPDGSQSTT